MPRERKIVKDLKASAEYAQIKAGLLQQLKINQTAGRFYEDLIEDYMDLWVTKNMLLADVKARGVTVKYNNGGGQSGYKKNDSVEQALKVNTQMLRILDSLGIKPSTSGGGDEDEL